MILLTGGAGFIGSNILRALNKQGRDDILLIDNIYDEKYKNIIGTRFHEYIEYQDFYKQLEAHRTDMRGNIILSDIDMVIHFGACTDTMQTSYSVHHELNFLPSKLLWEFCTQAQIPMIYASSAATYGQRKDFQVESELDLTPTMPYAMTKHQFDTFAVHQDSLDRSPSHWYGLKLFNVYGAPEYHKRDAASIVYKWIRQAKQFGFVEVFEDGKQSRDFIYIDDVIKVIMRFVDGEDLEAEAPQAIPSGIYNVGTGNPVTFNDVVEAIFKELGKSVDIIYKEMPKGLIPRFQTWTMADRTKLNSVMRLKFRNIKRGIKEYIQILENDDV